MTPRRLIRQQHYPGMRLELEGPLNRIVTNIRMQGDSGRNAQVKGEKEDQTAFNSRRKARAVLDSI